MGQCYQRSHAHVGVTYIALELTLEHYTFLIVTCGVDFYYIYVALMILAMIVEGIDFVRLSCLSFKSLRSLSFHLI